MSNRRMDWSTIKKQDKVLKNSAEEKKLHKYMTEMRGMQARKRKLDKKLHHNTAGIPIRLPKQADGSSRVRKKASVEDANDANR